MGVSRAAVEAVLIVISLGVYIGYHVWLIVLRGRVHKVTPEFHDFFAAGKLARSIWAETCARDEKDAILGVQQARNAMSACSYLATISAVLATAGITIILDESKTERMAELAIRDPILRHAEGPPLAPPVAILGLALGCLYGAFVCFAQSVRLYVHVGFYIRAVPSRYNPGTLHVREAQKVAIKAGLAFTVGLRLFYLFIPLVLWSVGVTALLFSSLAMTLAVMYMDWFESPTPPTAEELAESDLEMANRQEYQWEGTTHLVIPRSPRIGNTSMAAGDPARTTITSVTGPWLEAAGSVDGGSSLGPGQVSSRGHRAASRAGSERLPAANGQGDGRSLYTMSHGMV